MPKLKTKSGAKKRFKVTATGKVKHRGAGTSHRLAWMKHKQKRKLRGTRCLCDIEAKRVLRALAGGSY